MTEPDLADFQPLSPAEDKIVAQLSSGNFDRLGDGLRPRSDDPERSVRAVLLRFLILGGGQGSRPHEKGVRLAGAWITGPLDLEGCRIPRDIGLRDCHFDSVPVLRSAIIDNLFLDGSALPGLQADRLEARGGLFLHGATVTGEIRLIDARLGGNLECDGAAIDWQDGFALNANGLEAGGSVLFRGARVRGGIHLVNARLGTDVIGVGAVVERPGGTAINADGLQASGDFALRGAAIKGEMRLLGAQIGGDLDCTGATFEHADGFAVQMNRAVVEGAFFLHQGAAVRGTLNMTAARIGTLSDERESWPGKGDLLLNRCRYGAIVGGPVDAASRLDWLARQEPGRWGEDFWPQPHEQLAAVLREMGHEEDARAVLIDKERLQRRARRMRAGNRSWRWLLAAKDGVLAVTVAYGRQPLLALSWLVLFWLVGVAIFAYAEGRGAFKPNSPVVLRSQEWTLCAVAATDAVFMPSTRQRMAGRAQPGQHQLDCFRSQPEAVSYPEFNVWMYSVDTLLPVLENGQKDFWRPDPAKPSGLFAMNYFYFETMIGWVLSLLAVAGFSGIVKSN